MLDISIAMRLRPQQNQYRFISAALIPKKLQMIQLNRSTTRTLLKISAVLWVIWGAVHTLARILTISGDTATAAAGIADAVDPATLSMDYPDAVGAIINQHGFNLLWVGVVTILAERLYGVRIFSLSSFQPLWEDCWISDILSSSTLVATTILSLEP
ncbi:MAG: hypothetical protein AAF703_16085 [Cyanobacteria bacterium P01_D01_bin.105]